MSITSEQLAAAREELAAAKAAREEILLTHIANGVIIESEDVYIDPTVTIAPGARILPGCVLRGKSYYDAARIAADFTLRCIENTVADTEHWYGVHFEPLLPELMKILAE